MPGNACWEQETSSCEERFNQSGERRSRKQRMPRKIATPLNRSQAASQDAAGKALKESNPQPPKNPDSHRRPKFRCFLCPRGAPARAFRSRPYHSRESLMLHKLWRHKARSRLGLPKRAPPAAASITLRATVFTNRAFECQR